MTKQIDIKSFIKNVNPTPYKSELEEKSKDFVSPFMDIYEQMSKMG
jgi:hypothetical protein